MKPQAVSRWACVAALFSPFAFALSANTLPAVVIRAGASLNIAPERLTLAMSVQFLGFFVSALFGGILCDIFGKKRGLQTACIVVSGGALLWSFARSVPMAFAASGLMGLGGGVMEGISAALLADLFPRRRKFFLNLSQITFCFGAAGGPAIIGRLLPHGTPWHVFFLAVAVLSALSFLLYVPARIPPPAHEERIRRDAFLRLVRRRSFLVPCVAIFCYVVAESSVFAFANIYLHKYLQAPEGPAIYTIGLVWLAVTAGRIVCAFLPEAHSYEKTLAALLIAMAGALLAQRWAVDWRMSLGFFILAGLFMSGIWPFIVGLAISGNPRYSGTVVGLTVAIGSLGVVVAPPMMDLLLRWFPRWAYAGASLPLFLGAALLLFGRTREAG